MLSRHSEHLSLPVAQLVDHQMGALVNIFKNLLKRAFQFEIESLDVVVRRPAIFDDGLHLIFEFDFFVPELHDVGIFAQVLLGVLRRRLWTLNHNSSYC